MVETAMLDQQLTTSSGSDVLNAFAILQEWKSQARHYAENFTSEWAAAELPAIDTSEFWNEGDFDFGPESDAACILGKHLENAKTQLRGCAGFPMIGFGGHWGRFLSSDTVGRFSAVAPRPYNVRRPTVSTVNCHGRSLVIDDHVFSRSIVLTSDLQSERDVILMFVDDYDRLLFFNDSISGLGVEAIGHLHEVLRHCYTEGMRSIRYWCEGMVD